MVCTAQPLTTWTETNAGRAHPVPARPADHPVPRFARPVVHIPGRINPASRQSPRGARQLLPIETVRQDWTSLRDQVLTYDLVLATPPLHTDPSTASTEH